MLTGDRAITALHRVCADLDLTAEGARLLGPVGDNAVLLLPAEGVVARISDLATGNAEHQLAVARWLQQQQIPAVRARNDISQPVQVDDVTVTFWDEIPHAEIAPTGALGGLLRRLHAAPIPEGLLTEFDPWAKLPTYIERATGLTAEDRQFLTDLLTHLRARHAEVSFQLPRAVVHGDAHRKNLVRDDRGITRLLDLDHVSIGQPEWDLVVSAVYREVGWYSDQEYQDFVDAYGVDITTWDGYDVLASTRMLRMTAWLSARTGREPRLIPEASKRVASLRDPTAPKRWTPGV